MHGVPSLKRVCHITTVHTVKDTRIYHKECRALGEAGYDVKLVAVNASDTSSDYENVEIVNVECLFGSKLQRMIQAPKRARRAAESLDADIYHFHDPEFLFAARKMARKGLNVIYDSHEDVPKQIRNKAWIPGAFRGITSSVYRLFEHKIVKELAAVVTVVDSIAKRFESIHSNVIQVRNYPSLQDMPEPTSWTAKSNSVCYVGDLTRIRGTLEMVKSMEGLDATLLLGGRFATAELEQEVKSHSGWFRVEELGFISRAQVREVYAKAKVGLVTLHHTPSYEEAIPVKMLEYMASGMPYVASDFGWMKEVTGAHECGLLANPSDVEAIQKAIQTLLADDKLAQEMGKRGRAAVLEKFNWDTEKHNLLELYNAILK